MSAEHRKYTKNYPFYKEYVCPVCEGRGAVECCNADGTDCAPIPCDYCGGKGTIVENYDLTLPTATLLVTGDTAPVEQSYIR